MPLSEQLDRLGKSKLLTGKAGHEPAAADLAAQFQPTIHAQQRQPGQRQSFAEQQSAKYNPRTLEQLPGCEFRRFARLALDVRTEAAPTAARLRGTSPSRSWCNQLPQRSERIAR